MKRTDSPTGWRPRKSLGQNFLIDGHVAERIVASADLQPTETVLEVGPGQGALTGLLCRSAAHVVAVEVDPEMARTLPERVPSDNLTVLEQDVLRTDLTELAGRFGVGAWPVVGNLPYVISSRLLMHLVEQCAVVDRATIMLQREVGERILAGPGSRTYGLLSVLLQATGRLRRGFRVAPGSFRPVPKVESLVLSWQCRPPEDLDVRALIITVKAAFGHRRKRLDNALRSLPGAHDPGAAEAVAGACEACGIDPGVRAEHLSSDQFIALSRQLAARGAVPPRRT